MERKTTLHLGRKDSEILNVPMLSLQFLGASQQLYRCFRLLPGSISVIHTDSSAQRGLQHFFELGLWQCLQRRAQAWGSAAAHGDKG